MHGGTFTNRFSFGHVPTHPSTYDMEDDCLRTAVKNNIYLLLIYLFCVFHTAPLQNAKICKALQK